ncbi:bifunctional tRNA (5-methylaminomethyl-2-thiouridine)(34)-methyltransferase MnmD/FAD-dependent 5-carboxymethylaminomethyl-2-thiouridine(34) oxidoreductase MnmC [Campylobacter sp. LR185c]|uniref:bifunctional tRNA (5-methylaminomethyl-2-thiouridine)(34)-methyltransferase MnmD/FAD-dependent 5-carboxymethylaminomethyl-2-thiouridine(34) oxidoreductase MnmC n=1 Tax=Campylobacter sp. LR185c TaxID=2014525 RepID=UPI001237DE26|nr:bifunctional tRNA (5-methylaminomethyl-2-thiouridine)(34)-methyltransferase MnmD/FAD-dependent 5-carboxymethylaminomethyl-2-thiouridine(34) oxidoreductase MnmC [Campylobacter sp. LR185c]KAA6224718.1 bifunctional tRNA (5-methylaminomethyl-2-thiouridine)(34)-methyltransferase MnmD/FAD-dependent 5-carboxymethylaminomethyl-2-thiouridine(34) oxidoreductase MnmC [Campylobacter sp. LR185c]KAA8603941.1 bifunctional tRNA (5-methylaminomethyl-2-thiouridine)(34)-methyltransferase MnmD/FAD-dependent 5-car
MKKANLVFKDNTPFSLDFNDFYFNSQNSINEREFVYTRAFEFDTKEQFIIAETGFGLGLNFFLTLKHFLSLKNRPKRLFYVSVEGFYIEKHILKECYERLGIYNEFKEYIDKFLEFYPPCKRGYYRFYFKDIFLDLIFDDISVLSNLDFKANVWYLDGFSPSKNEEMFSENTIKNLSKLCLKNAIICTYSASSKVKNILLKYDFEIQKIKSFHKREMLRAFFKKESEILEKENYFSRLLSNISGKKIAIIGAGISGTSLAYELSLRGFEISIFEKNEILEEGTSYNESGILSSLILKKGVALGEFSQFAYIEASRFYRQILGLSFDGVMEFSHNELMNKRFLDQRDNILFCINDNKAFLKDGGIIIPKKIVKNLLKLSKAKLYLGHEFSYFKKDKNFSLYFKNADKRPNFDIIIYAMGSDTKDFINYDAMNLSKVRGQVSHLKPFLDTKIALSSKGYICPKIDNLQVIGASYDRLNLSKMPNLEDDKENLENIKEFVKIYNLKLIGSKVGFRSYSSDRFAIIGAFYDEEFYKNAYKGLLWTKQRPQILPKNHDNLYLNFGHGSRGFSTSIIAARYLCALICNEPLAMFKEFVPYIHPARFLIRKLKKGL